ncbi:MAG: LysM peptidoglycan-binding domain-containing protein [Anaerolineaceae bacterium]|nr:LysM peptidoglycan-binding domain-containing protein [Anaerolineaceae bacterium]
MSPEIANSQPKICPTCGTRLSENATRCLVCGRTFTTNSAASAKGIQGPRLPELTLSLPVALVVILLVLGIGAGAVYAVLNGTGRVVVPTATETITVTPTITQTPTASETPTLAPSATMLPPVDYVVKANDTCSLIAVIFKVSIQSIIQLNNLSADCASLYVGQALKIPQPTPTPSPLPTSTLSQSEATQSACQKITYTVKANDTLTGIALNYNVDKQAIITFNGMPNDVVYEGQALIIPLCARLPTPGPTSTETPPPPYPAPNLLVPADGASFTSSNDTITLQWASVGTLRQDEAYAVTIEDVTSGNGQKTVAYVNDTKYIVPATLRPVDNVPHILRWVVIPVRQTGTDKSGQPTWDTAGAASAPRVFSWWGSTGVSVTATP